MAADLLRHQSRKAVAVHCQCAASLHPGGVGAGHDEGAHPAHLLFQQSHRVFQLVGAQRVGTAQLREVVRFMGRGFLFRFHFAERHIHAPLGKLPGTLTACQTCTDHSHMHSFVPLLQRYASFFAAAFFVVVFLAAVFLAAGFFAAVFWVAGFWAASFSAAASSFFSAAAAFLV